MVMKTHCCSDPDCPECRYGPFQRNHYFTGKLLVERDFNDEQGYYVNKLRHHHQRLHGWGVVCGLKVVPHESQPCQTRFVYVEPGTAIDCCGREMIVREREYVDVLSLPAVKALIDKHDDNPHFLQICLRYKECPNENIPVLYDDCGCDEDRCAPNRILESYEFDALIVDKIEVTSPAAPSLAWTNTLFNITDVARVAVFDSAAAGRLYVLTKGAPDALYQLDLATNAVLIPKPLVDPGLALALAPGGSRLYVATGAAGADRKILVLDTADLSQVRSLDVPNSKDSAVELMTAADGRLVALVQDQGHILVWPTTINAPAGNPPPDADIQVAGNKILGLTISTNGKSVYTWDTVGHVIKTADLAGAVMGADITRLAAGAAPAALAITSSSGADELIVVDSIAATISILDPVGNVLKASAALANPGVDVAPSADGAWAYVLEKDGAGASFVQSIHLRLVRENKPPVGGPAIPAGSASVEIVLGENVQQLFVPYLGPTAATTDGSLAIFSITSHDCCDRLWDSINGCPSCDTGNCVVLATLPGYKPQFQMLDGPPVATDANHSIARIDNRMGRKLLPSTSALTEVIQCLCESGGMGRDGHDGQNGQPGQNGAPGHDGIGLFPDLPKILDIGWSHNDPLKPVPWDDFRDSSIYGVNPQEVVDRVKKTKGFPTLTVYFNQPMVGLSRQTFLVSLRFPQMQSNGQQWVFTGLYNITPIDIYGYPLFLGQYTTPHTMENDAYAYAFIPDNHFFTNSSTQNLIRTAWLASAPGQAQFDLPTLNVLIKGDFVYAGKPGDPFQEKLSLDADNIGGQVGLPGPRVWAGSGGANPSGDLAQGGDFESWLFMGRPKDAAGISHGDVARNPQFVMMRTITPNINEASADELESIPGITADIAARILVARKEAPFVSAADLRRRLRLSADTMQRIQNSLDFNE